MHFDEDPEGGGYSLVKWENGELARLELPAVGQSLEMPRLRGLLP